VTHVDFSPFNTLQNRMWRKENRTESVVHVFTSHFYTTLAEGGPKSVESWTSKKNIDIFQKKMIFIPINKSLHWSLCVVMNPIDIVSNFEKPQGHGSNDPFPCILFLDSLKAHEKQVVAKQIHCWLNAEWERLGKAVSHKAPESTENPFTMTTMKVIAPRSKWSW
jgi:Ulp1 family protease